LSVAGNGMHGYGLP